MPVQITVDQATLDQLAEMMREQGICRSEVVRRAVNQYYATVNQPIGTIDWAKVLEALGPSTPKDQQGWD